MYAWSVPSDRHSSSASSSSTASCCTPRGAKLCREWVTCAQVDACERQTGRQADSYRVASSWSQCAAPDAAASAAKQTGWRASNCGSEEGEACSSASANTTRAPSAVPTTTARPHASAAVMRRGKFWTTTCARSTAWPERGAAMLKMLSRHPAPPHPLTLTCAIGRRPAHAQAGRRRELFSIKQGIEGKMTLEAYDTLSERCHGTRATMPGWPTRRLTNPDRSGGTGGQAMVRGSAGVQCRASKRRRTGGGHSG